MADHVLHRHVVEGSVHHLPNCIRSSSLLLHAHGKLVLAYLAYGQFLLIPVHYPGISSEVIFYLNIGASVVVLTDCALINCPRHQVFQVERGSDYRPFDLFEGTLYPPNFRVAIYGP